MQRQQGEELASASAADIEVDIAATDLRSRVAQAEARSEEAASAQARRER